MSNVQEVSPGLLAAMNGAKANNKVDPESAEGVQNRFMTLLVTQMRNQDPLNPLDNAQVTSQLAQLSTVTGIDKLNTTLESLMGSYQSSQSLQAAGMIGHGVLVPGKVIQVAEGQGAFGIELAEPADQVEVTIRDANGNAVKTMRLGSQETGTLALSWDGSTDSGTKAPDGKYTFEVSAKVGDQAASATALSFGLVGSVSTGSQGVKLNLPTLGQVNMSEVRQIL